MATPLEGGSTPTSQAGAVEREIRAHAAEPPEPSSPHRPEEPDSPGCTPEQAERLAGYRARILELTTFVITHPYWATLPGPDRVEHRAVLKYIHATAGPEA
ncbi:hypothetical protein [Streptomyces sp. NPDC006289]|uniref:hypothetical protein n=1 Tax=Streptomyces sp. NPDC006289 TaxID=3156744 RepID=UPI0033AD2349